MSDNIARILVVCAVIAIGSVAARAQPPEAISQSIITLPDALGRTLSANAALRALGFEVPAAEGRALQSTYRESPQLNVSLQDFLGTDVFHGVDSAETTVTLAWVLERGKRERIIDAARARIDVSAVELEVARLDAVAETARRFIDCLVYQDLYAIAEQGVALAGDAAAAVQRSVEAGRAPSADLARAQAELARARLRLDDYDHELLSAYHRLSAQWGVTVPVFTMVAGDLAEMPDVLPFESLLARIEQNPDLTAFASRSRLAEAQMNVALARSRPNWTVSGGLRRIEATDDWAVVGGITIPLRMGNRNEGSIAASRATLSQIDAAREAARIDMHTELFVLYQELEHNVELAEALTTEVEPRLARAAEEMRRAFDLGQSGYPEFREVQTELLNVTYDVLDARSNAHRLTIEIERLTGESLVTASSNE